MFVFKVGKLAQMLNVHRNTITNWIKTEKLKATPAAAKQYTIPTREFMSFCREENIPDNVCQSILKHAPGTGHVPVIEEAKGKLKIPKNRFKPEKKLGSVMVVGGGIAGIQATLDLADAGYYVYMIEKTAGIGGAMAQLDKTFPTNDCSM
ncbi:Helix-turn-helix domain-containing protein [Desulfocicer vacuolatum DSM 3385]|uniref:Helix-turn-helix domain-containing protein n=1 Tax=Desulfocicer vacuolatum DSM 3385 TaxID=1121400 RepID=A0A1W2AY71_9BACT|nr:Helix-turn-helix domain-containing protein [Desulfocicer vacuolatum DSM 3385]